MKIGCALKIKPGWYYEETRSIGREITVRVVSTFKELSQGDEQCLN